MPEEGGYYGEKEVSPLPPLVTLEGYRQSQPCPKPSGGSHDGQDQPPGRDEGADGGQSSDHCVHGGNSRVEGHGEPGSAEPVHINQAYLYGEESTVAEEPSTAAGAAPSMSGCTLESVTALIKESQAFIAALNREGRRAAVELTAEPEPVGEQQDARSAKRAQALERLAAARLQLRDEGRWRASPIHLYVTRRPRARRRHSRAGRQAPRSRPPSIAEEEPEALEAAALRLTAAARGLLARRAVRAAVAADEDDDGAVGGTGALSGSPGAAGAGGECQESGVAIAERRDLGCASTAEAQPPEPGGPAVDWLSAMAAAHGDPRASDALLRAMPSDMEELLGMVHIPPHSLSFLSLFAGVGGRSQGYRLDSPRWQGVAVELRQDRALVHRHNDEATTVHVHTMTEREPCPPELEMGPLHHLSAGPPCQPYSRAGLGRGLADPRDGLRALLAAVERTRPLTLEIENVPALAQFGEAVSLLNEGLQALAYHLCWGVLDASHFGVPQRRRRLFLLASRLGPPSLPEATTEDCPPTVGRAIGDDTVFDAFNSHDSRLRLTPEQEEACRRLDYASRCVQLRELRQGEPARTLTCTNLQGGSGLLVRIRMHDGTLQRLSIPQAARLQGFPSEFQFPPELISERQAYLAIGDALPPDMACVLSAHVRSHIERAAMLWRRTAWLERESATVYASKVLFLLWQEDEPFVYCWRRRDRGLTSRGVGLERGGCAWPGPPRRRFEACQRQLGRRLTLTLGGLDLPGGIQSSSDDGAADAALRECREEVSLPDRVWQRLDAMVRSAVPATQRVVRRSGHVHVVSVWAMEVSEREAEGVRQRWDGLQEGVAAQFRPIQEFLAESPYAHAAGAAASSRQPPAEQRGLRGGALGDGNWASWANVRFRKWIPDGVGALAGVRHGVILSKAQDGQLHSYDVQFDGGRLTKTDLEPWNQVAEDAALLRPGQWQFVYRQPTFPRGDGAAGVCPQCFFVSDRPVCPTCGRDPAARSMRTRTPAGAGRVGVGVGGGATAEASDNFASDNFSSAGGGLSPATPTVAVVNAGRHRATALPPVEVMTDMNDDVIYPNRPADVPIEMWISREEHASETLTRVARGFLARKERKDRTASVQQGTPGMETVVAAVEGQPTDAAAEGDDGEVGKDGDEVSPADSESEKELGLTNNQLRRLARERALRSAWGAIRADAEVGGRAAAGRAETCRERTQRIWRGLSARTTEATLDAPEETEVQAPGAEGRKARWAEQLAVMLTVATASKGLRSYGPGDALTSASCRFNMQRRMAGRRVDLGSRTMAAAGPIRVGQGEVVQGNISEGTEEAMARDDSTSTPMLAKNLAYQVGDNLVRKITSSLLDSGAAQNAIDEGTARTAEKEGVTVRWLDSRFQKLAGFNGASTMVVGKCKLPILMLDELSGEWKRFLVSFHVLRLAQPLLILGVPFFKAHNARLDFYKSSVSIQHGGVEMVTAATADDSHEDFVNAVRALEETSHPFGVAHDEYFFPKGATVGVKIQVPPSLAGEPVTLLPLPDADASLHANRVGLRVVGPLVAVPDEKGQVTCMVKNHGRKDATLTAFAPIVQYDVDPEVAPSADMTVDEIVEAVTVGVKGEEASRVREVLRQVIFGERQFRRDYFSMERVGKGVGSPPAVLKESEEFRRSGKAPPCQAARPTTGEQRAAQLKYKNSLVENGQLVPSNSPYGAAVVMVRKPGGKGWRMAFDYRYTNDVLEKQHYGLKNVRSCVEALAKSKYYTTLDLLSAFWQTPLDDESRRLTAVNFEDGKYEWTVMPMGLQAASAIFQRNMDLLLAGMQPFEAMSFIDDVCVHGGDTVEEHLKIVVRVLDRIGGAGYTMRPDKCMFAMTSINWLGFHISNGSIRPDDAKTAQIADAAFPVSSEDMSSWIGLVQFLASHVPSCEDRLAPLRAWARLPVPREPNEEELQAFNGIKAWLTDERGPVLMLPDFEKPFYLVCDAASTVGRGALLMQHDDKGVERPIAYWSKRWQPAESRWHSLEHELCTLYGAIDRFAHYLSNKFHVITDAEPLVWLKSMKNPRGKYAYWVMEMQSFDFDVHHRPAPLNRAADAMSRMSLILPEDRPGNILKAVMSGEPVGPLIDKVRALSDPLYPRTASARRQDDDGAAVPSLASGDAAARPGAGDEGAAASPGEEAAVVPMVAAAYSPDTFVRKRVSAVVFSSDRLVVHWREGALSLPATAKASKREPLRDAAVRALRPLGGEEVAQELVGSNRYCLAAGESRHFLIPTSSSCIAKALERMSKGVTTVNLADPLLDVKGLPWVLASDAHVARRLQLYSENLREGARHSVHPVITTAVQAAFFTASRQEGGERQHHDPVGAHSLAALKAVPGTAASAVEQTLHKTEWERLDDMAREAVGDGVLRDGRQAPTKGLTNWADCVAALRSIQAAVEKSGFAARAAQELAGSRPGGVSATAEQGLRAVMSVDFEYILRAKTGCVIAWAQVAVGPHIFIFNCRQVEYLLGSRRVGEVPTLACWLEDPTVLKITQACASDVRLLAGLGVRMTSVFDTAVADSVIRRDWQLRKLDALVEEYVGEGLLPMKQHLDKSMHGKLWHLTTLPYFALVYAWQDVAWGEELFWELRRRLVRQGRLCVAYEFSRHLAERDNANMPAATSVVHLVMASGDRVLVRPTERRASCSLDASAGRVRLGVHPLPSVELPSVRFEPPLWTAAGDANTRLGDSVKRALLNDVCASAPLGTFRRHLRVAPSKKRTVQGQLFLDVGCPDPSAHEQALRGAGLVVVRTAKAIEALGPTSPQGRALLRTCFLGGDDECKAPAGTRAQSSRKRRSPQRSSSRAPPRAESPEAGAAAAECALKGVELASAATMAVLFSHKAAGSPGSLVGTCDSSATAGGAQLAAVVAAIQPTNQSGPSAAHRDLADGLMVHNSLGDTGGRCDAERRGLALSPALQSEQEPWTGPILRAVVTGRVWPDGRRMPKLQQQYALSLGQTGHTLWMHPLYGAAALANEPSEGERANCIFQIQDMVIRRRAEAPAQASAGRVQPARTARSGDQAGRYDDELIMVAVALLVQVAPSSDGVLTVHYGEHFKRHGYTAGLPPLHAAYVTEREVWRFLDSHGLHGEDAQDALLRCGAPLTQESVPHVMRARHLAPTQPVLRTVLSLGKGGPASVPARALHAEALAAQAQSTDASRPDEPNPPAGAGRNGVGSGRSQEDSGGGDGDEQNFKRQNSRADPMVEGELRDGGSAGGSGEPTVIDLEDEEWSEGTAACPILLAAASAKSKTPKKEEVDDGSPRFVEVMIHDGKRMLGITTAKKVPLGEVSGECCIVAGKVDKLYNAEHAALLAIRTRLGATWEWDELERAGLTRANMKMLGTSQRNGMVTAWYELRVAEPLEALLPALTVCFRERKAAPEAEKLFTGLVVGDPAAMVVGKERLKLMAEIVAGTSALLPYRTKEVGVPRYIPVGAMHRVEPEYEPALESEQPTRAFYDLNYFFSVPIPLGRDPAHKSSKEGIMEALAKDSGSSLPRDVYLEDPGEGEAGARETRSDDDEDAEGTREKLGESGGDEDDEEGRTAIYQDPVPLPQADDPSGFLRRLRPSGMPRDMVDALVKAQREDPFCKKVREQLNDYRELRKGNPVRLTLTVGPSGVAAATVQRGPPRGCSTAKRQRWERQLEEVAEAFWLTEDGVLYHLGEDRRGMDLLELVVPQASSDVVLTAAHDGMLHLGRARTLDALKASRLWWPTRTGDVRRFCRNCPTCAFNKVGAHHGEMHIPPSGNKPWQVVMVDLVDLEDTASGNRKALLFMDRFSRGVRAFPVPKTFNSKMFVNIVALWLVPDVGTPTMMISDRGSDITSKLVRAFYEEFGGIEPRLADSHMHTAVAPLERFNATLREMARAAWFDNKCEWDLYLPYLVMFYNATVQESTGYSPYFIEHGREPRLPWHPEHKISAETTDVDEFVRKHLLALHLVWELNLHNLTEAESQRKAQHDKRYQTNVKFKKGDRVLLLQPGRISKMEMPYVGPYRVLWGPDERDRYALRDLDGRRFNEFHVSKLKLWPLEGDVGDEYYVVERIVDARTVKGQRQYLIKWTGYSQKYNSWHTLEDLSPAARDEAIRLDARMDLPAAGGAHAAAAEKAARPQRRSQDREATAVRSSATGQSGVDTATRDRDARAAKRAADREVRNSQ